MRTDLIRETYLDFFADKGAKLCPSDSLVPSNDPTLLFTGAGMNQFKDYFLGIGKMDFRAATSCQKCIRTGDIMNVGVTPSHHTFFEMLGNFSFGDYFKQEAITWAWELLTGPMGIKEKLLQVSIHHTDDEAFGIWRKSVGLPENRITRLGDHDNFWPADAPKLGPNGPCGPCSEIFFDRGQKLGCGRADCGITCECRRFVEIWNLVFTQYERKDGGQLDPLPQKNIDTGAGLERFASCLQGTPTNMDIDIFQSITSCIGDLAEKSYGQDQEHDKLIRRIADHARAVTFCIADGVLPANSHRGYVLKRLLRRAVLDGRNLGIRGAFVHELTPVVARVMAKPYPGLQERTASISEVVQTEEDKFLSTLEKGLTMIDLAASRAKKSGHATIPGATAFELYDTYGFPYEVAAEVVETEGLKIDREGFDQAMTAAKMRAREGAKMKGDVFAKGPITEVKKLTGETRFTGYDTCEDQASVIAIIKGQELVEQAKAEDEVTVILDQTPFYGESGGQVGDTGILVGPDNTVVEIEDTLKIDNLFLHVSRVESGKLKTSMSINCEVNASRRQDIRRNHTATHLLHHALREVLGNKVEQRGSYVAPDRLRFDFQHASALGCDERIKVEEAVNHMILDNTPVTTEVLPIEQAKQKGAMALFGEKYGEVVRVVSVGDDSVEFCGGTHMHETGPIGSFRILAEESVSSGVRRIEAVTGMASYRVSRKQGEILSEVSQFLKVSPEVVAERIRAIMSETKVLKKQTMVLRRDKVKEELDDLAADEVDGVKIVARNMGELMGRELADAADVVKRKLGDHGVAVLAGTDGSKVGVVVTVGKALAPARLKAGDLVKSLAPMIGGGGGGRPDMAQAGGKNPSGLPEMLGAVKRVVTAALGKG